MAKSVIKIENVLDTRLIKLKLIDSNIEIEDEEFTTRLNKIKSQVNATRKAYPMTEVIKLIGDDDVAGLDTVTIINTLRNSCVSHIVIDSYFTADLGKYELFLRKCKSHKITPRLDLRFDPNSVDTLMFTKKIKDLLVLIDSIKVMTEVNVIVTVSKNTITEIKRLLSYFDLASLYNYKKSTLTIVSYPDTNPGMLDTKSIQYIKSSYPANEEKKFKLTYSNKTSETLTRTNLIKRFGVIQGYAQVYDGTCQGNNKYYYASVPEDIYITRCEYCNDDGTCNCQCRFIDMTGIISGDAVIRSTSTSTNGKDELESE